MLLNCIIRSWEPEPEPVKIGPAPQHCSKHKNLFMKIKKGRQGMTDKWEGERGLKSFCCSLLQHCRAGARAASRQDGSETSVAVLADCSHTQSLLYQRHNTVPGTHKKLRKKYDTQNVFIHCNYSSFLLTPLTQYSTHKLRKL